MALPKLNKNALFLGGAVLLGLVAALLSVSYIRERVAEATAAARVQVAQAQVVVSRRDLGVGDMVTEADLVTRQVPLDFVPADALTTETYGDYVNRLVRAPIKRGTPLSASALVPLYSQFSRVVVPGKVGYTLSVNENNSISGMIAPGDSVDILLTYNADENAPEGRPKQGDRVIPLLDNIVVLATGSKVGETLPGEDNAAFSSITLELDPAQAEKLTIGQKAGDLRVLLRNIEDRTPFGLGGLTEKSLMGAFSIGVEDVEYIIGGK